MKRSEMPSEKKELVPQRGSVPAHIQAFARKYTLGDLELVYEASSFSLRVHLMGIACIVGGASFAVCFFLTSETLAQWMPPWLIVCIPLILGPAWVLAGWWMMDTSNAIPRIQVYLSKEGIIQDTRGAKQVVRWGQVAKLWKSIDLAYGPTRVHGYRIERTDGTTCTFAACTSSTMQNAWSTVEENLVQHLLPVYIADLQSGISIHFGAITVTTQGIIVKDASSSLDWNDVKRITKSATSISFYKRGEYWDWATLDIASIPNAVVLLALLDCIQQAISRTQAHDIVASHVRTGVPIAFGSFSLTQDGVSLCDGKVLSWKEVVTMDMRPDGCVEVLLHAGIAVTCPTRASLRESWTGFMVKRAVCKEILCTYTTRSVRQETLFSQVHV